MLALDATVSVRGKPYATIRLLGYRTVFFGTNLKRTGGWYLEGMLLRLVREPQRWRGKASIHVSTSLALLFEKRGGTTRFVNQAGLQYISVPVRLRAFDQFSFEEVVKRPATEMVVQITKGPYEVEGGPELLERETKVLELLRRSRLPEHLGFTTQEAAAKTGLSPNQAQLALRGLRKKGLVKLFFGRDDGKTNWYWVLPKE
jgi:hypothetical protein